MRDHAVILTFPAHYYLTKLCIRSIEKQMPECNKITVLVDDMSELAWPEYGKNCEDFYSDLHIKTITISQVAEFVPIWEFGFHPWIKQQMIKMHMDLLFDDDEIFFTDGDVIFKSHVPYMCVPYTNNPEYPGYPMLDFYTSEVLKISDVGIFDFEKYKGTFRTDIAAAPFRDINLKDLKALRRHVESVHQKSFLEVHKEMAAVTKFGGYCISEWELIEVFKHKVLGRQPQLLSFFIHIFGEPYGDLRSNPFIISTCYFSEKQLSDKFWADNDIKIDRTIWNKIAERKYKD